MRSFPRRECPRMFRRRLLELLVVSLFSCTLALAHGGSYRGPGSGPPAPQPRPADTLPEPLAPEKRVPGWRTPDAQLPQSPEDANASARATWALSSGMNARPDLLRWQAWWGFNRDEFLQLKSHLHTADVLAGSDEAFLGQQAFALGELRPAPDDVFGAVAPALVQLLEGESSNELVSGALVALAKVGDAPGKHEVALRIAPFLADASQEVAETAAVALGILGTPREVELLREILEGDLAALRAREIALKAAPSERVRAFAAYGLGLIGQRDEGPVRERIVGVLGKWMREQRAAAAQDDIPVACVVALGLVPLPSDPFALPLQRVGALPERMCSFEEQVRWMLAVLEERGESPRVRAHVPVALARLLHTSQGRRCGLRRLALERFTARLEADFEESVDVRTGCVIALGQLLSAGPEDTAARAALLRVKSVFPDPVLACFALISLGRASCRPGFDEAPFAALEDGPAGTRMYLCEQLRGPSSVQRCYAALALGLLERGADEVGQERSERSLAALRAALKATSSPDETGACAIALGLARDRGANELLRQRLVSTSDERALGFVAVALGLVGDRSSAPRLRELVATSRFQPELLRQAALGLGLLGDKQVVPLLLEMLARAPSLSSQAAIASALGLIGDARALNGLIAITHEHGQRTDLARAHAAVALGMCADKAQLPWNAGFASDTNFRAVTSTLHAPDSGTGILDIL